LEKSKIIKIHKKNFYIKESWNWRVWRWLP